MYEPEPGYIMINVRTASNALPVDRAIVTIRDEEQNIISILFTDESGQTPKVKVLAPSSKYSEKPSPEEKPYSSYNIDADKEGYISVRNTNVPVYPNTISVQEIEMIPNPESGYPYSNIQISYSENYPPNL